jgi:ABC-type multidrug transport system fused ATPase/permease subunit
MQVLNSFTRAGGAAQRVLSLLDAVPDIDADGGEVHTPLGHVALDNVFFQYQMRPKNKVLKGVSLEIKRGEVCALVGRSGGGKSTIVHLLMRFYDPSIDVDACTCPVDEKDRCSGRYRRCTGRVLIDGKDLRELDLRHVHDGCGLVSQETQLFDGTVRENICYGLTDRLDRGLITDADIVTAATDANAHGFISDFEDGYETKVGEKGVRLSGGQKQRIALARVFLRQPTLLFLDEATSALDAESEGEVQDALDRLIARGNSTVLLIAHRLSTVINADKIAVIDDGQIAELGTHTELIARGGIYAALVAKQMARQDNVLDNDAILSQDTGKSTTIN